MKKNIIKLLLAAIAVTLSSMTVATAKSADWPSVLKLGVIPTEGGKDTADRFKMMQKHLEKVLGMRVELSSASDYNGIITAMEHKHIDMAYLGPKSYVEAATRANAEAVALEIDQSGAPGYYGIIITHKDSGIDSLDKAIDGSHTFSFTDPNSTSGCLVPSVLFYRDLKKAPEKLFTEVGFSGSHGASMLAVKNKKVEVASTNDIDLDRMEEKGALSKSDFNIIWRSELIPGSPMTVRKDLPASLKAAIAGALMKLNFDADFLQKMQIGGYKPADDTTYDVIRYLKRLKADLAKKNG